MRKAYEASEPACEEPSWDDVGLALPSLGILRWFEAAEATCVFVLAPAAVSGCML